MCFSVLNAFCYCRCNYRFFGVVIVLSLLPCLKHCSLFEALFSSACVAVTIVVVESPQMWVWPQLPFGGSPQGNWRTLSSSHSLSIPTLPLPPTPHGSFFNALGNAAWARGGVHGCGGGGPSMCASGGIRCWIWCTKCYVLHAISLSFV